MRVSISSVRNKCMKIYVHSVFRSLYQNRSITYLSTRPLAIAKYSACLWNNVWFHSLKGLRIWNLYSVLCTITQVKLSDMKMAASRGCACYLNESEANQLKINNQAKISTQNLSSNSSSFLKTYEMGWLAKLAGINSLQRQHVPFKSRVLWTFRLSISPFACLWPNLFRIFNWGNTTASYFRAQIEKVSILYRFIEENDRETSTELFDAIFCALVSSVVRIWRIYLSRTVDRAILLSLQFRSDKKVLKLQHVRSSEVPR